MLSDRSVWLRAISLAVIVIGSTGTVAAQAPAPAPGAPAYPPSTAPGYPAPTAPSSASAPSVPAYPVPDAAPGSDALDAPAGSPQAGNQAPPSSSYPQQSSSYPQPAYGEYAPPSAYPAPPGYGGPVSRAPGPGSHEHEGFFLRLSLGGGAASVKYRERISGQTVSDVKTRGLAAVFDIAVGGRVVENFIVHGNLSLSSAASDRDIDGIKDRSYDELSTSMWLLGAGATYYLMPTNLYFTLVIGTGGFVETRDYGGLSTNEEQIESGPGFAGSLAIGKEWWVGGRGEWAIGASITAAVYAAPIDIDTVRSTAVANCISLAFSATLN